MLRTYSTVCFSQLHWICIHFLSPFYRPQGTLDSGHFCLSGWNEVIMLKQLPDNHLKNACETFFKNGDMVYSEPNFSGKVSTGCNLASLFYVHN